MKEKLNLVEKLRYCPKGTEFWSLVHGEVEFVALSGGAGETYPVYINYTDSTGHKHHSTYSTCGRELLAHNLATLFPSKDNHDWDSVDWSQPKPRVGLPKVGDDVMVSFNKYIWRVAIYGGVY